MGTASTFEAEGKLTRRLRQDLIWFNLKLPIQLLVFALLVFQAELSWVRGTPANKAALKKEFDRFLPEALNRCTTCHLPSTLKNPERLEDFPHNAFGDRLRKLGEEKDHKADLASRLEMVKGEDADGDGVNNLDELLAGSNPGEKQSVPNPEANVTEVRKSFAQYQKRYRWEPFRPVNRPAVPETAWGANEIDAFIAAEHSEKGLRPRGEAEKATLMRRVYIDLIGLNPTVQEQESFLKDQSEGAYEALVDRLLEDPRYGERWGRHWMDIWRYSDWAGWSGGNQIRDSKPHIWRWRDWIVESLNGDKPYNQMLMEMLAADEFTPEDTNAVRATGFLARNYKMLSREQWLEDTIKHTSQAFLGVTMGCAKCHDHMTDPISQAEYFQMRAIFEPHQVRTDRVPGELDRLKAGLVRVYDVGTNPPTYFYLRGDERKPDTNRVLQPGVPKALAWKEEFELQPVALTRSVARPDRRSFVREEAVKTTAAALASAREKLAQAAEPKSRKEKELAASLAEARHEALMRALSAEEIEEKLGKESAEWKAAALTIAYWQRKGDLIEAKLSREQAVLARSEAEQKLPAPESAEFKKAKASLDSAHKKLAEAEMRITEAQKRFGEATSAEFKPRDEEVYPEKSSGRRAAFARWVADTQNPLTARVAMNHIWLRHFGRGIVTTPENFGAAGNAPSHPELLDWLAAEFMQQGWSMKAMHRLIVTSRTYRMATTPEPANAAIDPDNVFLWRMNSRRLDAELVRDNLLHVAGVLDATMGGPEIDNNLGLVSKRRSIYLRIAPEKEVEFLKIFDGPAVTECYQRHPSVLPQQALALANSELALNQARALATTLEKEGEQGFVEQLFRRVLARAAEEQESVMCAEFLKEAAARGQTPARARENLALVLLNHNDFLTVR